MDRRDNGFLFSDVKGKNNQKKAIEKIKQEKEQIKVNKIQEEKAFIVQKYLKGYQSRMNLRKKYEGEMTKNLSDLDKLSTIVLQQKNQIFYLPLKNLYQLLRQYKVLLSLRRLPKSKRKPQQYLEIVMGLSKWIQRSLEKPECSIIKDLYGFNKQDDQKLRNMSNFEKFLREIIEKLQVDNKSGTLMGCLLNIVKAREQLVDAEEQEQFDMMIGQVHLEINLLEKMRKWIMSRIELHTPFESIQQEKKNLINTAVRTILLILSKFRTTERTYDISVALQYSFINEIWSIPTINKYIMPMLPTMDALNYKNIFQAYYYSKQVDLNEEEKEEQKKDMSGNLIGELNKNERKMFIFANVFEMMHVKLLNEMTTFEIYPVLQVLESVVQHLSRRIFDFENASIDDYIMITILRNQLSYILDFKTTSKIFGHVFGETVNSKHSIFSDTFNPQAAISLTKIYSTILMIARQTQKVFQQIILGIAFNEPVLYKLWRFIDVYCGIESLLVRNVREYDQYNSFIHSLSLFCLAFTRNLWVTSFEEFLKNQYFERKDVIGMVQLLKALIIDLIVENKSQKQNLLDDFVLYSAGILLRLLHEQFAIKDFIDPKAWDITEIKWNKIIDSQEFTPEIKRIIQCMPECIPFDVRATLFQQMIKNDVAKNQYVQKTAVRIRRSQLFHDGYQAFMKVSNLKNIVGVVFINELGMQEEGHDAGGLFKEFMVNLSHIVFNPNYGLFLTTEKEKELYPNAQSHILFGQNDTNYFLFLGRLLGKAMYEGITLEPKFADFFLRRLIGKQNSLNDLKSLDPELYKQMTMMRSYEGNVEDLALAFSVTDENEVTGERREVDLIPGGSQISVTNQNKFRYIYMVADFRLNRRIKSQTDAFIKGFHEIIPLNWLSIFNEREIQMLISGATQSINIQDLKKYTKYMGGFSGSDSKIKMFWAMVEKEMNDDDQSKLLKFVTSCSRPPLMGFKNLHPTFTISKMDCDNPDEKLPTASTCFNILRLPPYSNAKIMKERVMYAIHSNAGFELA